MGVALAMRVTIDRALSARQGGDPIGVCAAGSILPPLLSPTKSLIDMFAGGRWCAVFELVMLVLVWLRQNG